MLPPPHLDGLERLAWYRAARAAEERKDEKNPKRERFEDFARKIAAVPKEEVDKEREKWAG